MRTLAALVFLVACEKSGPVESTPGLTQTTASEGPTPTRGSPTVTTAPDQLAGELAHAVEPLNSPRARREREREREREVVEADTRRILEQLAAIDTLSTLGDMSSRRPMTDLSSIDSRSRNAVVSGGGAAIGTRVTGGVGGLGGVGGNSIDSSGTKASSGSRVTVLPPKTASATTLTPDLVMRKVSSAYMAGIKRCYKTSLQQDPAARGKLTLGWKVNETGRTIDPRVTGFRKDLDDCIVAQMANWRFPAPQTDQGEPTEATFEITLQMVPQ